MDDRIAAIEAQIATLTQLAGRVVTLEETIENVDKTQTTLAETIDNLNTTLIQLQAQIGLVDQTRRRAPQPDQQCNNLEHVKILHT